MRHQRRGATTAGVAVLMLMLVLAALSVAYVTSSQEASDRLSSQSQQISSLAARVQGILGQLGGGRGPSSNGSLPVVDQAPAIRTITETWFLSSSAHQDRFDPSFVVVDQGDIVKLTLIDNDTVAHDLVIGHPYDITVNATVPGLINDLSGQVFTTNATNNSPGVVVRGAPGNVSATYAFVARFAGTYEFVCTYHAQVGMIGYLVVLPNQAYNGPVATSTSIQPSGSSVGVSIEPGAGTPPDKGFSPNTVVVVLGKNNTVVWTNHDSQPHTVTANGGSFDSGYLGQGASFTYTFSSVGVYQYHCTYHPWMTGVVVVKAPA